MYKLIVFIPKNSSEKFKEELFSAGAGSLGNYSHCAFESTGVGQFKPLDGAEPSIGQVGAVEKVEEIRLETMVAENDIENVIKRLYQAHPYEEPAFDVVKLENQKFQYLKP
jgi:hypothetical protein